METVNQENTLIEDQSVEKTFTQAEVDAIVGERLARDRAKYADYEDLKAKAAKYDEAEEANKSELQKATERADALQAELDKINHLNSVKEIRDKVSKEKGVPAELLNGDTEEDCTAQADAILAFAKPDAYPAVKDNGEVRNTGKSDAKTQFADWLNQNL